MPSQDEQTSQHYALHLFPCRAKQHLSFLQRAGKMAAVCEHVMSGHRVKLYIPSQVGCCFCCTQSKHRLDPDSKLCLASFQGEPLSLFSQIKYQGVIVAFSPSSVRCPARAQVGETRSRGILAATMAALRY